MRLLISGSWVRAPRWANFFLHGTVFKNIFEFVSWYSDNRVIQAPWLSWLKRLSRKQEIPSSTLGGALILLLLLSMATHTEGKDLQKCRDPGSNRGPLDLQSNALPTELSRLVKTMLLILVNMEKRSLLHDSKKFRSYRDLNSDRWIQSPEC